MGSKYGDLGVDVDKKVVRLFTTTDQDLYQHAFGKIYRHPTRKDILFMKHPDGVGSKSVQRYLHFKETGDASVFEGDAQDLGEMNIGDVMCVGLEPIALTNYLAFGNLGDSVKAAYVTSLDTGFKKYLSILRKHGINLMVFAGGETADLVDQIKTYDASGDIYAEEKESRVITGDRITPRDIIIGVRSGGQAVWEEKRNSGHMSNGSTAARHCLMLPDYAEKYPEIQGQKPYTGRFRFDYYHPDLKMTVGEALISPTRLFSIVIKELLKANRKYIHGLVLNTGGGQKKCLRVGKNIHYVKDFRETEDHDPFFYLVKEESGEDWENMFKGFNMGWGLDVISSPAGKRPIMDTIMDMGIGAEEIGYLEESHGENRLTVHTRFGTFEYSKD